MRKLSARKIDRPSSRVEIMIGRSLAACIYPYAAWRLSSPRERLRNLLGYALIGYITVLGVLVLRSMMGISH